MQRRGGLLVGRGFVIARSFRRFAGQPFQETAAGAQSGAMAVIAMGVSCPRLSVDRICRSTSTAPSAVAKGQLQQQYRLMSPSSSVSASSATSSSSSGPVTAIRRSIAIGGPAKKSSTAAYADRSTAESAREDLKWWEKGGAPNISDVHTSEEFVEAVSGSGDKLVIVEFYASWCGSCRALYPKFCKIAAEYSDVRFLKVNIDDNRPMCKSLNVKVLPFFHFYRGTVGRLDAFSCSLSKLQKLRDAIAKHHDGPCEDCSPPEPFGDIFSSLLDGRSVR